MLVAPATAMTGLRKENFAAALAYITFVPAIVFLASGPLRHNRLIRFHSWQSIFFAICMLAAAVALRFLFSLFSFIPRFGYLLGSVSVLVTVIGCLILWAVLLLKALQGEMFKLPLIGDFAEKA